MAKQFDMQAVGKYLMMGLGAVAVPRVMEMIPQVTEKTR